MNFGWAITGAVALVYANALWRNRQYGKAFFFAVIGSGCIATYMVRA